MLDTGNFYAWSTNAHPLEAGQSYSPFALYTMFEHGGDYQAAARILAGKGYESTKTDQQDQNEWPDPLPIPGEILSGSPQDYPYELLPEPVRRAATEIARFAKVPEVSPGVVGLACLAVAIGKKAKVVERPGLTHYASMFFALFAPSGERKTPPFKYMTKPLDDYVDEMLEDYERMKTESKTGGMVIDAAIGKVKLRVKKDGVDLEVVKKEMSALEQQRIRPPVYPCIYTTNTTEERLYQKMYDRGGAFAVMSGEGRKVIDIIMGQYSSNGQTGDSIYLAGISGDTLTRDRVGGDQGPEESRIREPCLTACIMVQPDKYLEAARVPALRESGALARIWPVELPSLIGTRIEKRGEFGLGDLELEPYELLIRDLLEVEVDQPHMVYLSEDAQEARRVCHNEFERLMAAGEKLADVPDIASKVVSQIAKVAMLLHIADNPNVLGKVNSTISLSCWQRAEGLGRYHLWASIKIQRSAGESDVHRILKWIKAGKAAEVLEALAELHYLKPIDRSGKKKPVYLVNPKLAN